MILSSRFFRETAAVLSLLILLGACASQPVTAPPAAAAQATRHAVAAQRAMQVGAWQDAAAQWQEALLASAAIDDWAGQGEARLGLANAQVELGQRDLAKQSVASMPAQTLYLTSQRARAAYQLALLALPDAPAATQQLQLAQQLCAVPCAQQPWFDNLRARIALLNLDAPAAAALAQRVATQDGVPDSERAHAWRILAQARLQQQQGTAAMTALQTALVIDRKLAVPAWLADDFALQVQIGQQTGQSEWAAEGQTRLASLCAAVRVPACADNH